MTSKTGRPVGRPPELDTDGNPIAKALVNVTIPVKLRDFLSRLEVNRSKLFTTIVMRMYEHEICPRCYNENIEETPTSWYCNDCSNENRTAHLEFKECANIDCNEYYNLIKTHPDYNSFKTEMKGSKLIKKGCSKCII